MVVKRPLSIYNRPRTKSPDVLWLDLSFSNMVAAGRAGHGTAVINIGCISLDHRDEDGEDH